MAQPKKKTSNLKGKIRRFNNNKKIFKKIKFSLNLLRSKKRY